MTSKQQKQYNLSIQELLDRVKRIEASNTELIAENDALKKELAKYKEKLTEAQARIKKTGKKQSHRYKMVTILYSDVKGFSKLSDKRNPEELVDELDKFFFKFDEIVKKYNIEKVNAIGDTYLCAGGIPQKNRTNPIEVVMAALEMKEYMMNLQEESKKMNQKVWDLTFGIHTGPVNAEKKGKKKITWEIKGDTLNIASRIESSSDVGLVNISEMTYEFVQEFFRCEYRGKLPVKYMGDIAMYSVKGFRPEFSENSKGLIPNKNFKIRFALIKFDDLEEYMLDKLEKELPEHLFYHNLKHTIDVTNQVEVIGRGEGINDEELLYLKTAALFHDAGHIIESKNHEFHSTQIANEILPKYGYEPHQIKVINSIIMATQLPPQPQNLLQNIICDADLDYLGRSDFIPVSGTLYKELQTQGIVTNIDDWNRMQIKFLTGHQFFTKTANSLREVNKQKQIDRIKKLLPEYAEE